MTPLKNSFSKTTIFCFLLLSSCLVCEASLHKILRSLLHPPAEANANTCPSNCCQTAACPTPRCYPHQVLKHNAGWCGICPKCMTQLKMGYPCQPKPERPCPDMPTSECGHGLQCQQGKCCG